MKTKQRSLLFGLLFSILGTSCAHQEVHLTREQLNMVDSLFLVERKIWLERLEDSCLVIREAHFDVWVDSMQQDRLRDIEKMLGL